MMRLNKPIGIFLLLWPTLWALWIASEGIPPLNILLYFCCGVVIMRSAGCVINDIADRHYDGSVARTRNRPLVLGSMTLNGAIVLFLSLCLAAFIIVLQFNRFTIELSVVALLLATIYPFTKRFTYLPQLVLGASFAWSIPLVFASVQQDIPAIAWLLYIIATLWPVAYDSIYALMDREDDLKIGIKSTAILFGKWDVLIIFLLQLIVVAGLILLGRVLRFNYLFYIVLLVGLSMIGYQIYLIKQRTSSNYYRAFYNNHWLGLIVFIGIASNYL